MKQKKQSKLSFNKTTVANLNNLHMRGAVGGIFTYEVECPSIDPPTCKPVVCEPSLICPTPNTNLSYCECPTIEFPCTETCECL